MFGKAAIYIVLGFSGLFLLIANNMFTYSNDALNNYTNYYDETVSSNIAISAANIAANNIFLNSSWTSNINNLSFQNGTMTVSVNNLSFNRKEIVAMSNYNGRKDTVRIMMQPSNFAKFAHFSVSENSIYYITGDTVWGPIHTQDKLYIDGSAVFWGKVTTKKGLYKDNSSNPKFYGGYESGVSIPLPGDFTTVTSAAYTGGKVVTNKDVYLYFNGDGTVDYKEGSSSWKYDVPFDSLAPNGVFLVDKGNIFIKGTISGQVTVAASQSTGNSSHGKVYIVDDLVYKTDPTNPNCTDMLGIVATNDVIIANTPETRNNNGIDIQASIFSLKGSFTAEDYSSLPNTAGSIRLYGGIIEKERGAVGTFDTWSGKLLHGYYKKYKYDERFMVSAPPAFPTTGGYEIISWLE